MGNLALTLDGVPLDTRLEDQAAAHADEARRRYEAGVIQDARNIAAGRSKELPRIEHLLVLLEWLDGATSRPSPRDWAPF